jgi:ABC-2 type transport system ATP-binding protein
MEAAIETDGLTRRFGNKTAVDSLTLSVPRGSVFAFLGRNGSGKTTTIRMLLGFLRPTSGSSKVLGCDSMKLTPEIRGRIGYMTETSPLHELMTVGQEARFASGFYDRWNTKLFDSIIDHFKVSRDDDTRSLSRGQRTGVSLALAVAHEPELLILDDPGIGLDPVARRMIVELMLSSRADGCTVLFSSHQLEDVARVADYAAILDYSRLRVSGSIEELTESVVRYRVSFPPGAMPERRPEIPGLLSARRVRDAWLLTVHGKGNRPWFPQGETEENAVSFDEAALAYLHGEDGGVPTK